MPRASFNALSLTDQMSEDVSIPPTSLPLMPPAILTSLLNSTGSSSSDYSNYTSVGSPNASTTYPLSWCHDLQGSDFIYSPTHYAPATRHVIAVAFIFLIIITVVGNGLVIITVITEKPMKKITRALVVSMAASDILVAMCGELQSVVTMLSSHAWALSDVLCEIFTSADLYFSLSGILHIVCLAGERYLAICHPFLYERLGRRYLVGSIVAAWTVPVAFSFVPILAQWHRLGLEDLYACLRDLEVHVCTIIPNRGFSTISFLIMFALPSLLMAFCYVHIYRIAMAQKGRMSSMTLGSYTSDKVSTSALQSPSSLAGGDADGIGFDDSGGGLEHEPLSCNSDLQRLETRSRPSFNDSDLQHVETSFSNSDLQQGVAFLPQTMKSAEDSGQQGAFVSSEHDPLTITDPSFQACPSGRAVSASTPLLGPLQGGGVQVSPLVDPLVKARGVFVVDSKLSRGKSCPDLLNVRKNSSVALDDHWSSTGLFSKSAEEEEPTRTDCDVLLGKDSEVSKTNGSLASLKNGVSNRKVAFMLGPPGESVNNVYTVARNGSLAELPLNGTSHPSDVMVPLVSPTSPDLSSSSEPFTQHIESSEPRDVFKVWRRSVDEGGSLPPHLAAKKSKILDDLEEKRLRKERARYLKTHRHGFMGEDFRTARSISLIFVCFAVTWSPYWVTMLAMPYLGPGAVPDPLIGACLWLAYFGSALNPFVYYFSNASVKKGIRRRFRKIVLSYRRSCQRG